MDDTDMRTLEAINRSGVSIPNINNINESLGLDLQDLRDRLEILEDEGYVNTVGRGGTGGGLHAAGLTARGRRLLRE